MNFELPGKNKSRIMKNNGNIVKNQRYFAIIRTNITIIKTIDEVKIV